MRFQPKTENLIPKLTALWAVSESALGGIFHAAKIPFSGIFLGSFSVIIVTFLAFHSQNKWKAIMQATVLVIMIKVMISLHSPFMAYIALLFQGVLGALVYATLGVNKLSAMFFGGIALLESAFQKIFTLTLLFGMHIWDAVSKFFDSIFLYFHCEFFQKFPLLLISLFGLLYLILGIFAGNFAYHFPLNVQQKANKLQDEKIYLKTDIQEEKRKKSQNKIWYLLGILLFILSVFIFTGESEDLWIVLVRTFAAIFLFYYVLRPLFSYLIKRWVENRKQASENQLDSVFKEMPQIRKNLTIAHQLSAEETHPISKIKNLFLIWIALSLYFTQDET